MCVYVSAVFVRSQVRQMLTVIISALSFSHNLSILQWISAISVFSLLFLKARSARKASSASPKRHNGIDKAPAAVTAPYANGAESGKGVGENASSGDATKYKAATTSRLFSFFFAFSDRRRATPL